MSQNTSPSITLVRAEKPDVKRLDKLATKLEAKRGGKWPRPNAFKEAVNALERELNAAEAAKVS